MKKSLVTYLILLFFCGSSIIAQSTKRQELEQERQQLRKEIEQMKQLLTQNEQKERSVLDQVATINTQISIRENLIKVTNQQANLLTREINVNLKKMEVYRNELKALKEDYASMIRQSYKSKSKQNRIMFLLSSSDFTQAYKRLQYMKQYNKHRKDQADQITDKNNGLQFANENLLKNKEEKEVLLEENRLAKKDLQEEQKVQKKLMVSIRKKEGTYIKQIKKKQQQANAIDKAIEKLIREAIAKANKKAGKKTAKKGSATAFALTPEETKLAAVFTSNKGRLPWPVNKGRLSKKFGRQPHPTLPNIMINSSGVEIETMKGEKARCIFEGEVIAIQKLKGAGRLVQIRHGNYITTYYNIQNIKVKEGQKVVTKQAIGEVRTNPNNGRSIMKFLIYQNANRLNPQNWIYKL